MIEIEKVKNILITRTDRLGDVILTLPLVTESKKIFKGAKIFFFVKEYLRELIYDYEAIDGLLIEEDVKTFYEKYKLFKGMKLDLVINVKPRFDLALIFFLIGIKYRIGTGYRWYSFLYNYKVYEHRKISLRHESDYNLNLLKTFFKEAGSEKKFRFEYPPDEKNNLEKKLRTHKLSLKDKFIIIHPGSGGSAKDLPYEKFAEYVNILLREYPGIKVVFTGLRSENNLIEDILNLITGDKTNITHLAGKLTLRELLILTDSCTLFISNSTGPIHIAGALNKRIIGFYPNQSQMSDTRWKPLGSNVVIIKPDISDDMNGIEVERIAKATREFLK